MVFSISTIPPPALRLFKPAYSTCYVSPLKNTACHTWPVLLQESVPENRGKMSFLGRLIFWFIAVIAGKKNSNKSDKRCKMILCWCDRLCNPLGNILQTLQPHSVPGEKGASSTANTGTVADPADQTIPYPYSYIALKILGQNSNFG